MNVVVGEFAFAREDEPTETGGIGVEFSTNHCSSPQHLT